MSYGSLAASKRQFWNRHAMFPIQAGWMGIVFIINTNTWLGLAQPAHPGWPGGGLS